MALYSAKIERINLKNRSGGRIWPKQLTSDSIGVIYQPGHGLLFIPESIGFRIGEYVDYLLWTNENDKPYLCIVSDGCVLDGRRVCAHKNIEEQRKNRKLGIAQITVSCSDLNRLFLNLPEPQLVRNTDENRGFEFASWVYLFNEHCNDEWTGRSKLGVVVSLTEYKRLPGRRQNNGK